MNIQDVETKLKNLEGKAQAAVSGNKAWLLLLLIPLIILKYRSFIINLLINDSNRIVTDTAKQDTVLKAAQSAAEVAADSAVAAAQQTKKDSDNETVDENWNKK